MTITLKSLRMILSLLFLFIIAASINALMSNVFLMRYMSALVLFVMAFRLLLYFSERIIDHRIRHQLMAVAGLIRILIDLLTTVVLAMVLTNDSHWWVFHFQPGYRNWDSQYERGFLFFVLYFWMIILLAAFVIVLFHNCRLSDSRKMIWVPMLVVLFGNLYLILYALG
ncbi:MAG: hypothetical protein II919_03910 [Lachnospiraceae bacterium]|nr:hypothetical protein [Lachnospiraceae bacterium]